MRRHMFRSALFTLLIGAAMLLAACGGTATVVVSNPQSTGTGSATSTPTSTSGGSATSTPTPTSGGSATSTPTPTSGGSHTPTPTPTYADGTSNLFVHVSSSSNVHTTSDNAHLYGTYLDNPDLNGNPGARLYVSPNWSYLGTDTYDNSPIGVWYDPAVARWMIYNDNQTTMPTNVAFNVLTNSATNAYFFTATSTSGNISGDNFGINDTNPSDIIIVTHDYNTTTYYYPHTVGVYYASGSWRIFNEDASSMPAGLSFFVDAQPGGAAYDFNAQATGSNLAGDGFSLNNGNINGNANKLLFVTPNWTFNNNHVYDASPMGVYYYSGSWLIFKESRASMPTNMAFNVIDQG